MEALPHLYLYLLPSHYFQMHATDAVRAHAASMRMWAGSAGGAARDADGHRGGGARRLASKQPRGDAVDCGSPPSKSDPADPMWFTQAGCSLASMDNYSYLDEAGAYRTANKGELIQAGRQRGSRALPLLAALAACTSARELAAQARPTRYRQPCHKPPPPPRPPPPPIHTHVPRAGRVRRRVLPHPRGARLLHPAGNLCQGRVLLHRPAREVGAVGHGPRRRHALPLHVRRRIPAGGPLAGRAGGSWLTLAWCLGQAWVSTGVPPAAARSALTDAPPFTRLPCPPHVVGVACPAGRGAGPGWGDPGTLSWGEGGRSHGEGAPWSTPSLDAP